MKKINIETEKFACESLISREITQEILQFGVNQFQIKKIIELLAFELEDNNLMRTILSVVRDDVENIDTTSEEKQSKPSLTI